jgi:hypothetical protein
MVSPSGETEQQWTQQVLADIGAPDTANNEDNLLKWMTAEEPTSDWWDRNNPLNASLGTSSTSGLGSYPDLTTGAQETADMIEQSNMSGIAQALHSNASPDAFSAAVVGSPWAASHYGGNPNYISDLPIPNGQTTAPAGSSAAQAELTGLDLNPANGFGVPGTVAGAAGSAVVSGVEGLFGITGGEGLMTRILLGIVALIFLIIGLNKLFDHSASPSQVLVEGAQSAPGTIKKHANAGAGRGQRPPMAPRHNGGSSEKKSAKGSPFKSAKAGAEDVGKAGAEVAA